MTYLRMTVTDAMGFWDEYCGSHVFNPDNGKTFTNWYRLPDGWLAADGKLMPKRRAVIFAHLYGPKWQSGNEDGSKHFVLKTVEQPLSKEEAASHPWRKTDETCYKIGRDGVFTETENGKF